VVERVGRSVESLDALVAARAASTPALILHDPEDREVPWHYAVAMAEAWRGSRLLPARSLGHRRILHDAAMLASVVDFALPVAPPRRYASCPSHSLATAATYRTGSASVEG
jgi:hypothetical protein